MGGMNKMKEGKENGKNQLLEFQLFRKSDVNTSDILKPKYHNYSIYTRALLGSHKLRLEFLFIYLEK